MAILAVDIGATFTKIALVDGGRIVERESVRTPEGGPEELVSVLKSHGKSRLKGGFERIGVGVPGMVDTQRGIVRFPPNLPGWEEVYLSELLKLAFGTPVWIINDANAAVLGEWQYGAGRGSDDILLLTLGTGVGGGVITGGRLLKGVNGAGAELGHIMIDAEGPRCNCGNYGCLEAYIGSVHFLKRAREYIHKWGETELYDIADLDMKDIYEAALRNDELALFLFGEYGRYLGYGLVSLIHIFDPEIVILGGGVSGAFEFFYPALQAVLAARLMTYPGRKLNIKRAELGENAGLMGAYYLALREGDV